jgi:hypothetical protein
MNNFSSFGVCNLCPKFVRIFQLLPVYPTHISLALVSINNQKNEHVKWTV